MSTLVTGRPPDDDGDPIDGTGFEVAPDGPVAELLAERTTVETGVGHTFRNEADETALIVTSIHDPGRPRQVLPALGGLAHDDSRDPTAPVATGSVREATGAQYGVHGRRADAVGTSDRRARPRRPPRGLSRRVPEYMQPAFRKRHVERPDP